MSFGLPVEEPYSSYIGFRGILNRGGVDFPPDRISEEGTPKDLRSLRAWANRGVNEVKHGRKMSPWKRMRKWCEDVAMPDSRDVWAYREGQFVIRASTLASHGYVYVALFRMAENSRAFQETRTTGGISNGERARCAVAPLLLFAKNLGITSESLDTIASDLLANTVHLAHAGGYEPEEFLEDVCRRARLHFIAESSFAAHEGHSAPAFLAKPWFNKEEGTPDGFYQTFSKNGKGTRG